MLKYVIFSILFMIFTVSCSVVPQYIKKEEGMQVGLVKEPYQDRKTTYTLNVKLIDVETAQVISSATEETKTSTEFKKLSEKMTATLMKDFKAGKKKDRLAVIVSKANDLSTKLALHIETDIAATKNFVMVERAQMDKVLKEQQFSSSDLVDEDKAVKFGKLAGVTRMVVVSILETKN